MCDDTGHQNFMVNVQNMLQMQFTHLVYGVIIYISLYELCICVCLVYYTHTQLTLRKTYFLNSSLLCALQHHWIIRLFMSLSSYIYTDFGYKWSILGGVFYAILIFRLF